MKKILLSLFAVLCTMGAWAQPKVSEAPNNGQWAANTTWYTMKNGNGNYINRDYADGNGNLKWNNNKASIEDVALWCIVGNEENGYLFYNKSVGASKALVTTGSEANARTNFADVATATKFWFAESKKSGGYWCVRIDKEGNNYWNARDGYVALWNSTDAVNGWANSGSGDNGSAILFEEVDVDGMETLTYTLVDASDNVYSGTYEGFPGTTKPTLNGVAGYTLANEAWSGTKFTATITFPFPVSKVAGVTNATMIHQGSWNADKRWHAVGDDVKVQTQAVDPENISEWLWAIYPQFADGAFTFTIKNISADKYVNVNLASEADVQANNKPVTLGAEGTAFTVSSSGNYVKFNYVNTAGTALHFSINSSRDTDVFLGVYGGSHNGDNIGFPAYSVVTISNVGYSTIYLPFDAVLPEGLTAYAVTATSATSATMTALEGIKANNGAILNGAPATKYVLTAGTVNSDWSTNLLEGSVADTEVTGEAYVLGTVNNVTGFYSALLTNGKFKNNAGRAYLPVAAGARFLSFDFGTETAIDEFEAENGNVKAVVYDLAGRRVQKAQKGLYIVNGVKVIK